MSIASVTVGAPAGGDLARGRITAQDLVTARRALPRVQLPAAFDLDWDPALAAPDRAARASASVARLRAAGLLADDVAVPATPDGDPRLDGVLSRLGATLWAVAAAPLVVVEVTAWDRELVRHGWFATRGDVTVGLVRARAVVPNADLPGARPTELDPIEVLVGNASQTVNLIEELWPDADAPDSPDTDVPPATLGLVDAEAFLLALAAGDPAVVDEVAARTGLTQWPVALRGLEDGVLGGVDLTVVARPDGRNPHRSGPVKSTGQLKSGQLKSTGHWILGAEGWRGLRVSMPRPAERGSVADVAHAAQVCVTGQSRAAMRRALVLGLTRAWEVAHG